MNEFTAHRAAPRLVRVLRWSLMSVLIGGLITITGCSSLSGKLTSSDALETEPRRPKPIELTYRTDSGRLNRLGPGQTDTQQVSSQPSSSTPVPAFTASTLVIKHPHPAGLAGYSQVTVEFRPRTTEPESRSLWNTLTGQQVEVMPEHAAFGEVWQMEIPDWQLASLISQLKERQFFRRVKVLGHESDIETVIDQNHFAKAFPAVPELDAMIMNIRRDGRRIDSGGMSNSPMNPPALARRPTETDAPHAVTQQAGPYVLQRLPEVARNSRDSDGHLQ